MTDRLPDKSRAYPVTLPDGTHHQGTVFLNRAVDHPNWHVGDYTYASDFAPPKDWASHLAPYLFANGKEHLHIGKFCQIAHGVRFITSGANHAQDGLTTYPFPVFDPSQIADYQPDQRDTHIGHDVWLGYGAIICPGATIGNGVIVGAHAVVRGSIPDYAVVTGNPATPHKLRFDAQTIATLQELRWWDWPDATLAKAQSALSNGDLNALIAYRP